ncbi:hypothetical protein KL942_005069 [Ogataea angusta]|uniref:Bicarbonate transporter-like transmembrane domain-containing protein n=1 Tax=Pichia angusta TaxID=870730 RepID=A0ABQ7RQE4_PICAN|nr:hypothetical protein KL942_005069 [Ogataea angusta]KAG7845802.1 hypothetical protein KL940_005029 [Ogataea angusta]
MSQFVPGRGIYTDIKTRLIPYYVSDITDGFTYRVIPAAVYIFFTNLLPAMAFAQDMYDHANRSYGTNEVLLSSAMAGIIFGLFSGTPLCIVGVTGPISIFNYTVYNLMVPRGTPYFQFMCWICLWSMVLHFLVAITNSVNFMRYVTKYSSLVMALFGLAAHFFGTKSHYVHPLFRKFVKDYGTPLSVVFFTGFIHFGGRLKYVDFARLPITRSFRPTSPDRPESWYIPFWQDISVGDVFLALPFGILLTILFYFDHNVSSLMCQSDEFPLRKPSSFHYDFMLLGITTGIAGILGIPAPNGLIPQAPMHTEALCVHEHDYATGKDRVVRVVEQRLSNMIQGLLTLVMMTRPFLVVLGQIPQAVLAGLFFIMAIGALNENEVVQKLRFLFTDPASRENMGFPRHYFLLERKWFLIFLALQLAAFGFEFGITCTKGAIGFPGVLMLFMILAIYFPTFIPPDQLRMLDSQAADDLILKSLKFEKNE